MTIDLLIEFDYNTHKLKDILDYILPLLPFKPISYFCDDLKEGVGEIENDFWETLIEKNVTIFSVFNTELDDNESEIYRFSYNNFKNQNKQSISLQVPHLDFLDDNFIEKIILKEGLKFACVWDGQDAWNEDKIKGVGRHENVSGVFIIASSRMWYGREYYKHIPKKYLLSCPHARIVKELKNEITYIELFDYKESPSTPINRERQRQFRAWAKLDELEEKLTNINGTHAISINFLGFDEE